MKTELITIRNKFLTVEISTLGAELQSVTKNGEQLLWDGNPEFWSGRAPMLFPICGGLKEDKYLYEGKEYTLPKHGFAKSSQFVVEKAEEDKAVFFMKSTEETKIGYPFDFELRVVYTLIENSIKVQYLVTNLTDGDMYFSIGAHEAYFCPEGIEEYSLVFEKNEYLTNHSVNGNLLTDNFEVLGEDISELPLCDDFFKIDALIFLNLKSNSITLKHKNSNKSVKVDFDGFDYLLAWKKVGAKYLCIEPWCGLPDIEGSSYDFTEKKGIRKLAKADTADIVHTITFE